MTVLSSVQFIEKLCPNHECYNVKRKLMKIQFPSGANLIDPRSTTQVMLLEEDTALGYTCTNLPGCCSQSPGTAAPAGVGWRGSQPGAGV